MRAVDVPRDAVVLRFRPTEPESVLDRAMAALEATDFAVASVFADVRRADETEDDLLRRLLIASEASGRVARDREKYWTCSPASRLLDLGYTFWKDEDDDEVDEHYSVSFGTDPTLETATTFLAQFDLAGRRSAT